MKILSYRVQPNTASAVYATGDKVYFQGDKWTEHREEATRFANTGALLQAFSEHTLQQGNALPVELCEHYAIEDAEEGTGNHVTLTDEEVRLAEFLTANARIEGFSYRDSPIRSLHEKLDAFGLSRERTPYHLTLQDASYHMKPDPNDDDLGSTSIAIVKDAA